MLVRSRHALQLVTHVRVGLHKSLAFGLLHVAQSVAGMQTPSQRTCKGRHAATGASAPVSILHGTARDAYLACDAIVDRAQLAGALADHLPSLADRRLMLNDGSRYLSLAVPVGEYRPPPGSMKRLRPPLRPISRTSTCSS